MVWGQWWKLGDRLGDAGRQRWFLVLRIVSGGFGPVTFSSEAHFCSARWDWQINVVLFCKQMRRGRHLREPAWLCVLSAWESVLGSLTFLHSLLSETTQLVFSGMSV